MHLDLISHEFRLEEILYTHGKNDVKQGHSDTLDNVALDDEVDGSRASASYGNGVLRVELPKIESGHRRKTKINVN